MQRMDARLRHCALAGLMIVCLNVAALRADEGGPSSQVCIDAARVATRIHKNSVSRRRTDDGTARSENFRVSAPADDFIAESVAAAAEHYRRRVAAEWFGSELPTSDQPTLIHVELAEDRDVGLALLHDGRPGRSNRIWLHTSAERATGTTLAHEVAHIVLSERFPVDMPVWATEGVSCQYDDAARIAIRREIISRCCRTRRWPSLSKLLNAHGISATDEVSYAAAVSLTDYLIAMADRQTFLEFVAAGRSRGWDAATQKCYELDSVDDLEHRWQRWVYQARFHPAVTTPNETQWIAIHDDPLQIR